MQETGANVVLVSAVCDNASMVHICLPSDRHHAPCAARRTLFALCPRCVGLMDVQNLEGDGLHEECGRRALPKQIPVGSS